MNDPGIFLLLALMFVIGLVLLPRIVPRMFGPRWERLGKARWLLLLGIPAVPLAGSLLLEFAGTAVPAKLISKSERISISSGREIDGGGGPSWSRILQYRVSFQPTGVRPSIELDLRTDTTTFDRLPNAGAIKVRYFHWLGLITYARWVEESPWSFVRMFWEDDFFRWFSLTCSIVTLWLMTISGPGSRRAERRAARRAQKSVFNRSLFWLASGLLLTWIAVNVYSFFVPGPTPNDSWYRARAKVRGVSSFAEEGYSFVQLFFQPKGYATEVVAVDTVDSPSIAGLSQGHEVEILYPPGNPRQARMVKATRKAYRLDPLVLLLIGLFVIVGAAALYGWISERAKQRKNRVTGASKCSPTES